MTYQLSIDITADPSGFRTGVGSAAASLDAFGERAAQAEARLRQLSTGLRDAASATTSGAAALARHKQALEEIAQARAMMTISSADATRQMRAADEALVAEITNTNAAAAAKDTLRAKYVPLFALELQHEAVLTEIATAQRLGAISADEATAAIDRQTAAYARNRAGVMGMRGALGGIGKLSQQEKVQLSYQLNDIVVSLASGMNPALVALQQGSQITPLFGGIKGTLTALGQLITPTTVALGGLTVGTLAGVKAWNDYVASTRGVEQALRVSGNAAGTTMEALEAIARAGADAGKTTVAGARSMEAAFLRTGKISVGLFDDLIGASKNFAATIGGDAETAAAKLAEIFADPAKGADTLKSMGLLDASTARYIQRLAAQGRGIESQTALFDAFQRRLVDANESTTMLGRAWDAVARAADNAWDALGRGIDRAIEGPSRAERIAELRKAIDDLTSTGREIPADLDESVRRIVEADLRNRPSSVAGSAAADALRQQKQEELNRLQAELAEETMRATRIGVYRQRQALIEQARTSALASPANAGTRELDGLRDQVQLYDRTLAGMSDQAEGYREISRARDAAAHAVETYVTSAAREQRLAEIDIALMRERDPVRRADLAAEREKVSLQGEVITSAEAAARVEQARNRALAESTISIGREIEALDLQARSQLDVARAYEISEAAGIRANARREAAQAALSGGINVEARERQILAGQIADAAAAGSREASSLDAQAEAQGRLNDQVASGAITYEDMARARRVEEAIHDLTVMQLLAEGELRDQLAAGIDRLRSAYARLSAEQGRSAAQSVIAQQQGQIQLARAELVGLNMSTAARARWMASVEAEQRIRAEGIATGSAEAEQIRQNAVTMADLSIEIYRQRTLYDDFGTTGRDALDSVNDALARGELSWDSLETVATSAIASITKSLLNFGTQPLTSGLQGMIGAAAASLGIGSTQSIAAYDVATNPIFHDGGMVGGPARSSRTVAAAHWDRAPRYHAGGILPGEQAVIARNGEGIFTPRQMDNANQLFSALAQQQQASPVNVTVVNNAGVEVRTKQRKNSQGGMDLAFELDRAQAGNAMNPASAFSRSLSEGWGAQPPVYARGA